MAALRWQTRLRLLMHYKSGIRRELKEHTLRAVSEKWREIELFADNNIALDGFPESIETISQIHLDERVLRLNIAAVYFANSGYFQRDIDLDDEGILVNFGENQRRPTYNWLHPRRHMITLIPSTFRSYENFFHDSDSETRHAVHHDLLEDQGLSPGNLAKRALLAVTETMDEGLHQQSMVYISQQLADPFINDFFPMLHDGHDTAKHISLHLAIHPRTRWMQLYWLSRLPIRQDAEEGAEKEELRRMVKEISVENDKFGFIRIRAEDSPHDTYVYLFSPYRRGTEPLTRYYAGQDLCEDPLLKKLAKIRSYALEHFPYAVMESDAVELDGKKITCFASQLDYVLLKLSTTRPKQLYESVGQKTFS